MERKNHRQVGLARALSKLGYCARSAAGELIRYGHVSLNGRVRRDPEHPVHLGKDRIAVRGLRISASQKVYLALNKPRGVVTTAADEKGRRTVYDLLDPGLPWLAPVGRLDQASEGLLLLTNDSEWGARIADPGTHLDKTYHVQIRAISPAQIIPQLLQGVTCGGVFLSAKHARLLRQGKRNAWLEIVLDEGKNRQIRRILASLGIEVLRLVRVSVGPLTLGELKKGASRPLTPAEKAAIDRETTR